MGGVLVGVSLWTLTDKSAYLGVMSSNVYLATAYILLSTGLAIIVLAIIGCTAAVRELKCLLMTVSPVMVHFLLLLPHHLPSQCDASAECMTRGQDVPGLNLAWADWFFP